MKIAVSLLSLIFVHGCAINVVPKTDLSDSNIPTQHRIYAKDIEINKLIENLETINFVVLKTEADSEPQQYFSFMKTMLENVGFREVIDETEFARRIIQRKVEGVSGSISDLVSMHRIYSEDFQFLTISTVLKHGGNALWEQKLEIIDPSVPEPVLKVQMSRVVWVSVDEEFNYPLINLINDWYKASEQ